MMNMMYNSSTGGGFTLSLFYGLHMLSITLFAFGAAFLLFWAFKHLSEQQLCQWGWTLVVIGTIACLLTFPAWPSFFTGGYGRMGYGTGAMGMPWMMPMMGGVMNNGQRVGDWAHSDEASQGKDLYAQLQAKEIDCTFLSEDEFALLGDYFMGQQTGAAHEQMDSMMEYMMGEEAERQMHIIMGKRLSGCVSDNSASVQFPQEMLDGDMMRGIDNQ